MRDAVIVEAVRTPVGKRNGGLSGVHPVDLSAHVLKSLAERSGIDPALVDDVIWGCVQPGRRADLRHRPHRGARRGLAGDGHRRRPSTGSAARSQQSVHFAAAGLIAGPVRRGRRRRRRVDEPGADGLARSQRAGPVRPDVPATATTASSRTRASAPR